MAVMLSEEFYGCFKGRSESCYACGEYRTNEEKEGGQGVAHSLESARKVSMPLCSIIDASPTYLSGGAFSGNVSCGFLITSLPWSCILLTLPDIIMVLMSVVQRSSLV